MTTVSAAVSYAVFERIWAEEQVAAVAAIYYAARCRRHSQLVAISVSVWEQPAAVKVD